MGAHSIFVMRLDVNPSVIFELLAFIYVSYRAILRVSLPGWKMWQWECTTIIGMAYECVGQ